MSAIVMMSAIATTMATAAKTTVAPPRRNGTRTAALRRRGTMIGGTTTAARRRRSAIEELATVRLLEVHGWGSGHLRCWGSGRGAGMQDVCSGGVAMTDERQRVLMAVW